MTPEPRQQTSTTTEEMLSALLRRCASGDASAFRDLYIAQAWRLTRLAMRITDDADLAADAVHDTLLQVWTHAATFDAQRGDAGAWLTSIVRYRALDIKRPRWREKPVTAAPDQKDASADALTQLIGDVEAQALHRCLKILEPHRRAILTSAYVDGVSRIDLAAQHRVPIATMKSWIKRDLARLKHCLRS